MIIAIVIGLIVGAVAKILMPGKDPGGWVITIALGIFGALVATWIGQGLGWYGENQAAGFIASTAGAMVLLLGYRLIVKPSAA